MITYTLPQQPAEYYAQNALHVLQSIQDGMPEVLQTMLRADVVLTLSGVRAQTTYIDFPDLDDTAKIKLVEYMRNLGIDMFTFQSDVLELEQDENWWINHRQAMTDLGKTYAFEGMPAAKVAIDTFDRHVIWSGFIEQVIVDNLVRSEQGTVGYDLTTPHHIRFGMLLGYPAEAIISSCHIDEDTKQHDAKIAYHDMHDAAWPIYSFGEDVKDSPTIAAHQKLWSDILTRVYESDWYKTYSNN